MFQMRIMARELAACISAAHTVTDSGVKLPILRATHIAIENGTATFIATNTDQTVQTRAACQGSGVVVLDTQMLLSKASVCNPEQPIDFDGDGKIVTASQGRTKWKMPCLTPDEFPLIVAAQVDAEPVSVVGRDLVAALVKAREGMQPKNPNILGGAHFDFSSGGLHIVGAAGAGLHSVQVPGFAATQYENFTLPETSLGHVQTLFQGAATCEMRASALAFSLTSDSLMYRSKLLEGTYPPYRNVIPRGVPGRILLDAAEFAATIRQALAIRDDGKSLRLAVHIENGAAVRVTNSDGEESTAECSGDHQSGTPVELKLSPSRLAKALATLDADTLQIEYTDHMSPIVISPVGAEFENLRVIMPLRA